MLADYYIKCTVCGKVTLLKYQMGYVDSHPLRFKCPCGVTLNGQKDHSGIHFQNASSCDLSANIDLCQVIACSPEFLTNPPKKVEKPTDTYMVSPFIMAIMNMDYDKYKTEFSRVLSYKAGAFQIVKNCNELFDANNIEQLKNIVNRDMGFDATHFPIENAADALRTMIYVNQIQYMNEIGQKHLNKTQDLFADILKKQKDQIVGMAMLLNRTGNLERWRKDSIKLQTAILEKVEYLLPVIGVDYYKSGVNQILSSNAVLTAASFDDVKTLYVDLYEHICRSLGVVVGLDNIVTRNDFNKLRANSNIAGGSLEGFIKEEKNGKIVNYLSDQEPFEKLLGNYLNKDIRNAIGHFNYEAHVVGQIVPGSYGQTIKFIDIKDETKYIEKSLKEICYYIWQMYKSLAEISELTYRFQTVILAYQGIKPSSLRIVGTDINLRDGTSRRMKKIYPNDKCPCGSGLKYKKCCEKRFKGT